MYKITLIPQVGVSIEGVGQVNFGDSREKLFQTWGKNEDQVNEKRLRFKNYGCFIEFKKSDDTFEAIEFWNDYKENKVEVYLDDTEILQGDAQAIKAMLQIKNNNEPHHDGWFVNIDVIFSGGSQKQVQAIINQTKTEGVFEGNYKDYLLQDLENAKHFTCFGIGYKGYCKDGLAELDKILNG